MIGVNLALKRENGTANADGGEAGKTGGVLGGGGQMFPMLRVNGELVDQELVEETFHRVKTAEEQKVQVSCCERDPQFYEQAEQEVADSILIAQEAEKRFEEIPEEEVKPKLKEMIDVYREHGASWDMLEAQRDMMRHEIAASLRMDKLIQDLLGDDNKVSDEEIAEFYEEHNKEYRTPAEARSLHLMKTLNEDATADEVFSTLCAVREEALEGADFEELAKRETEKSTGELDLGWITLDRPTNPFEATLFSMREDEISPVIVYEHAMHLVKVMEKKDEQIVPLEEVREELENRALARKRRDALQALAVELRETATIEKIDISGDEEE
jgi:parvulin-like peptidyl-prolyl isomerase